MLKFGSQFDYLSFLKWYEFCIFLENYHVLQNIGILMKKYLVYILLVLLIGACSIFNVGDEEHFVTVKDTHFMLGENPYYFVGTNFWYGCYLGSPGETGDRERLERELDLLVENGITNLRVLAASEKSEIGNSLTPAVQAAPGEYDEDLLVGLDYLLEAMAKREMKAVVFLNNYWEWSGGMSQYNAWFGDEKACDPMVEGWVVFMNKSARFYKNREANRAYRKFIKNLINRTNTVNGKKYSEDATIMAWQLANEPRPGEGKEAFLNVESFYCWIDETAAYIHSLDPNHLVTTGNEGTMGTLESEEVYLKAHASRHLDYITFHIWAKNWSWYNANDKEGTLPTAKVKAKAYFDEHMKLARQLNKPITLEEFGLGRDFEQISEEATVTARDEYFKYMFSLVADSAKTGAPIAGANFWAWGGEGRGQHTDAKWRKGDSFVGDPPQEPQGLNSVFDTDNSTLKVIKTHYVQMKKLSERND